MNLQLTFDDGPLPDSTALQPILDEVNKRGVKAGFFVLGQEVEQKPDSAKKIIAAGHVIGNHTWDHLEPKTSDYTDAQIVDQFQKTHTLVQQKVNVVMRHWRAPRNDQLARLTGLLSGSGKLYSLSHCDFNADSKDSQGVNTVDGMVAAIKQGLAGTTSSQPRVLFHVIPETASALPKVLDKLVQAGHSFVDFGQST